MWWRREDEPHTLPINERTRATHPSQPGQIELVDIPILSLTTQRAMVDRVQASRAEIVRLRSEAETVRRAARAEVEALILGPAPAGAA